MATNELLAAIIGGDDGLQTAAGLLRDGLSGLAAVRPEAYGLSQARAAALAAALELARRLPADSVANRELMSDPAAVMAYLRTRYAYAEQEQTGCLYVNARNRLIQDQPQIFVGTLDRALVEPREILKRALLQNAAGMILYHNHPSGDPSPSREDREFTRRLASAGETIGCRLLDHVVVGREGCVSFREIGLI